MSLSAGVDRARAGGPLGGPAGERIERRRAAELRRAAGGVGRLDNVSYRAVLEARSGGSLLTLRASGGKEERRACDWVRGAVGYLSRAGSLRLMRKVAMTRRDAKAVFLGLNYSDDVIPPTAARAKADLRAFVKRLQRISSQPFGGLWAIEYRVRESGRFVGQAVPHFHLLLYGLPYLPWQVVAEAWCRGFDYPSAEARKRHKFHCSSIKAVWSAKGAARYMGKVAKYLAKGERVGPENIGRRWGLIGQDAIPWAELVAATVPWAEFHNVRRYLLRAARLSNRRVSARFAGVGVFVGTPEAFLRLGSSP